MEDPKKIDEQIREMNASFAEQEGFKPEEAFDKREAEYDKKTDKQQ